tara:strand:+ start:4217 stop:4375 length:159 start_codon:yes stop_codon:yes gene_type:complete
MESYDNCVECGEGIGSARQIAIRGVQTCDKCKPGLTEAEKDFISRQLVIPCE